MTSRLLPLVSWRGMIALLPLALSLRSAHADVLFVNASAARGGDGQSWQTAYQDLQDALDAAAGFTGEIWIAEGTYRPDRGTAIRSLSFELLPGIKLLGGFAGTEADPSERQPDLHPTVLSGDLLQNDAPGFANITDNSFHVVSAFDLSAPVLLDSVAVRGGNASGLSLFKRGGGILAYDTDVTAVGCTFASHVATRGGALAMIESDLVLLDCVLEDCKASSGGAIDTDAGSVTMTGTVLSNNHAMNSGGAVEISGGALLANSSAFLGNSAGQGGAIRLFGSHGEFTNVEIANNTATATTSKGGGLLADEASDHIGLTECFVHDNVASFSGGSGGIHSDVPVTVVGGIFSGNIGRAGAVRGPSCVVSDAVFQNNQGSFDGALWADEVMSVERCIFTKNEGNNGSAIRCMGSLVLSDSQFLDNLGTAVTTPSQPIQTTISGCDFIGNMASGSEQPSAFRGQSEIGHCTMANCLFESNTGGFGVVLIGAIADVSDCVFLTNNGPCLAGRLHSVSRSDFVGNTAVSGSAIQLFGAGPDGYVIANCRFVGNATTSTTQGLGGALWSDQPLPAPGGLVMNCVFTGNTAAAWGAGAVCAEGKLRFAQCSFQGNVATQAGDGIYVFHGITTVHNSLLWNNGGASQTSQIVKGNNATIIVMSSSLQGWNGSLGGTGNNGLNPLFLNPAGLDSITGTLDDDLTLAAGSPAIGTASLALLPADVVDLDLDGDFAEPLPFDASGAPRVVADLDRGAYENQQNPFAPPIRHRPGATVTTQPQRVSRHVR